MKVAALAFAASSSAALALTPAIRALARRWRLLDDRVSSRKIHERSVPRLGGVAIVVACYGALAVLDLVHRDVASRLGGAPALTIALAIGSAGVAVVGLYDDLRGAGAPLKLSVELAMAALAYALGVRIDAIVTPFGGPVQLGAFGLPLTLLWIVGVTNALNLLDGLDGLAAGVATMALAVTFLVAVGRAEPFVLVVAAAVAGAVLGFLVFNLNPASIFMGDSGSLFLGFVLATTSIHAHRTANAVALLVPAIALGLPLVDTLLAIVRRALRGAPLFSADRAHVHHQLLDRGLSHRGAVQVLYGVSGALGVAALYVARSPAPRAEGVVLAVVVAGIVALRWAGCLDASRLRDALRERRRNVERRARVRRLAAPLRRAGSLDNVWSIVRDAATALDASGVALHLGAETRSAGIPHGLVRARFDVRGKRRARAVVELGWNDGRARIDRDTEIAIELLCQELARAVDAVGRGGGSARRQPVTP